MKKEISFEDLPLKMQEDWAKYINKWKNDNIEILSIQILTADYTEMITYKIYYEFANILGLATYRENSIITDTEFQILTIGEVKEMYNLSTLLKELNRMK